MPNDREIYFWAAIAILLVALILVYYWEEQKRETFIMAYGWLYEDFGVPPSDFAITSLDADFSRGGYMKGEGINSYDNVIRFYYDWGPCSSGGSYCGYEICFSAPTSNHLYALMKEKVCDRTVVAENSGCLSGEFENTDGDRTVFSLNVTDDYELVPGLGSC